MRPHLRVASTTLLAALVVPLFGAGPAAAPATPAPAVSLVADATSLAQEVLRLVNAERAKAGCGPVSLEPRLTTAATRHSQDMATRDYFDHEGPGGNTFVDRAEQAGYSSPRSENIAAGNTSAQETMRQWMTSSGHRRNILDCTAKEMGLGVASSGSSEYGTYWTQEFGLGGR